MLDLIIESCGLSVHSVETLGGGDINQAFCINTEDKKYFLKVNNAERFPLMFEKESAGLLALKENSEFKIPNVIKYGTAGEKQFLLLEWIEPGAKKENFWNDFGSKLALMHKKEQASFGWSHDNFIGSVVQKNTKHTNWMDFYTECRILPLVEILANKHRFVKEDVKNAEGFCRKLSSIFPEEKPALLHGDLWSGNFITSSEGVSAIFDPAVYNGHREMDIGMTLLFGGFHEHFYNSYNEVYPLEKEWQQRVPFTQIYPLLVHAVMFSGGYVMQVKNLLKDFNQ